ncbi:disintegrin and metalloproteinase domain-containing protein 10 [Dermacentor silvarum]|uniref:disintegrin and metalloproteinase domain-containing protein 10 n=1 Tax=Dermacentor silvarum TaxID=543639 RepID=UPI002101064E|nr:disintegrin and metalloproteinase domain-containing protein 10 [Dermacentor silvarum]
MHLHLCSGRALNAFVRHYEPLSYDPVDVHGRATRWKRSASRGVQEQSVEVAFRALERDFRLRLVRDRSSFSDDFSLVTNNGPVDVNLDHLYSGHVVGSLDESHVVGAIMDGVFVGRIAVLGEEYHVERASRFFPSANGSSSPAFHSVLYSARDVLTPGGGGPLCGLHGTAEQAMHTLRSRYRRGTQHARMHRSKRSLSPPDLGAVDGRNAWFDVYTASNDQRLQNGRIPLGDTGAVVYSPFLAKGAHGEHLMPGGRQPTVDVAGGRQNEPRLKRVCNLEINVDHTLYGALVSDMSGDEVKARNELTNMISTHTAAASEMFGKTDFGGIVDISFAVQKVKLDDCEGVLRETNLLCRENLDGAHLLFVFSRTNHDGFCASVLWTHRVLPDGMLGIAFVAEPEGDASAWVRLRSAITNVTGRFMRRVFLSLQRLFTTQNYQAP